MSTNKESKKYLSVVTYCIALICLLLGFFLPIFNGKELLFMALPDAFCTTFGIDGNTLGDAFSRMYPIIFTGTKTTVDFAAVAITAYALITAIGVVMLIPVLAAKSNKKTANACAYVIEVAACVVLFVYTIIEIMLYLTTVSASANAEFNWDYGVIGIAFGGTLLMLIIQSLAYKKGSGFMKLVMAVLGAAGVLCLFAIPTLFSLETQYVLDGKLWITFLGSQMDGISLMTLLLTGGIDATEFVFASTEILAKIAFVSVACAALMAIINFALDIMAIGATTKKGTLVVDVVRYVIEALFIILAVVMIFVVKAEGVRPALLMYVLLGIAVIQLIISAIRCAAYQPALKTETNATVPSTYFDDTTAPAAPAPAYAAQPAQPAVQPVYLQPVYAAPAPAPAPAAHAPASHTTGEIVYTAKEVYRGPTDSFISRLTDSEKIEFAKLFLEKINGSYANIPDYVIGGDNKEFFSSIFIYLGKFRSLLSDGLMNKIYEELNLLN